MMDVSCKDSHIVTENDISASLQLKEEVNDELDESVSLDGSEVSSIGTLSDVSTCSAYSLRSLKEKKNQLIESIKSVLSSSRLENECSTPNSSFALDELPFTSTPCQEHNVPPAAKFLKDWRGFSNIEEIADKDNSSEEQPVRYEEAFESLKEILGESQDMLGAYESALEVYHKNEEKKLEEIMSFFEEQNKTSSTSDITVIDLVTKVDDDKPKDDNDNTITLSDDSTTIDEITVIDIATTQIEKQQKTSPELDPKDPENVIIAAEEGGTGDFTLVPEEDEDRLLASDDEEQGAAPTAAVVETEEKVWAEFVSNDPDENADNNDPQWERLRNLGSDYERYMAVRQRWRNIDIPNPKKDLTCRCRQTAGTYHQNPLPTIGSQSRKRPRSPDDTNFNNKRSKSEPCTLLFDMNIERALADLELKKKKLDHAQERAITSLADTQRLEQIDALHRRTNEQARRAMKERHCKDTIELMRNFQMRRDHLYQTSRQTIAALRRAAAEVQEFHEFYPDTEKVEGKGDEKNSLTYLSSVEVREILEIEDMFTRFEEFYYRSGYEQQC